MSSCRNRNDKWRIVGDGIGSVSYFLWPALWLDLAPNSILALSASLGQKAYEQAGHGAYTRILLDILDQELTEPQRTILSILNTASRDLQARSRLRQRPEVYFSALDARWSEEEAFSRGAFPRYPIDLSADQLRSAPAPELFAAPRALCPPLDLATQRDCDAGCPELRVLPDWRFPVGTDAQGTILNPEGADFGPERDVWFRHLAISTTPITYQYWVPAFRPVPVGVYPLLMPRGIIL